MNYSWELFIVRDNSAYQVKFFSCREGATAFLEKKEKEEKT